MRREDCMNCVCLVKGENAEWICDECQKEIEKVEVCPEEAERKDLFEWFMIARGFQNTTELIDYVTYLEDVKADYEILKGKVANLHRLAEQMY